MNILSLKLRANGWKDVRVPTGKLRVSKRPEGKNRNTHHDDQENILKVLPEAESEEKSKVSLQQLQKTNQR